MKTILQEDIKDKELSTVTFDKKRTSIPKIEVDLMILMILMILMMLWNSLNFTDLIR